MSYIILAIKVFFWLAIVPAMCIVCPRVAEAFGPAPAVLALSGFVAIAFGFGAWCCGDVENR